MYMFDVRLPLVLNCAGYEQAATMTARAQAALSRPGGDPRRPAAPGSFCPATAAMLRG